jgi:adhesin/invasin
MRVLLLLVTYCFTLLSITNAAQSNDISDEAKAKAFFKDSLEQSAENYVSARIEQSLSERFRNVEIDIADLDGEDTKFSIFTVQPLYDNQAAGRATFFQGGIIATDNDDTLNLGLGQRWILNQGKVIAGLNLFYDNEWDAGHERMSVGGEVLTSVGDIRVNSYTALSDSEIVNGVEETALDGMDMELALPLPYLPNTRIHAKSFKWDGENGAADLEGDTISLRSALPLGFTLEAGSTSYDGNAANDADFVSLSFNIARFHQQQYVQQPKLVSSQAYQLTDITDRRFEKVRRTNRIVKQIASEQGGGLTVKFR